MALHSIVSPLFSLENPVSLFLLQEHFQEQLHELQQKIHVQQAVIENQKEQIEKQSESQVSNLTLDEEEHLSHEALKVAFSKLQVC